MAARRHRLPAGAIAILVAVVLSGCVRVSVDTTVHEDDTYSQEIVAAVDPQALEQAAAQGGMALPDDVLGDVTSQEGFAALLDDYPEQVTVTEYRQGDLEGVAVSVDRLPLSEFEAAAGTATEGLGASTTLRREGDTFVVTLTRDDSLDEDPLAGTGVGPGVLEGAIDFEIVYRFPGQVSEASAGEVNGNTVTLGLSDVLESDDIRIVAGADPSINWGPLLQWGGIALAFAVIIGGAALLVLQDRRKRHTTHLPPPRSSDND